MANVTMAICRIQNHRAGGIILESKPGVKVSLLSNTLNQNNLVGIYLTGSASHPKIKKNEILETTGTGIYCSVGTAPQIMENILRKNRMGIYVESADPLIFKNEIKNCFESAVVFSTVGDVGCGGEMSMCTVRENEENGIWIKGVKCSPKIIGNPDISLCRLAGIKVSDHAHPTISGNFVKNNLAQGILLVEGSSAHILKNEIEENMKANIAFGGMMSGDTVIERNLITKGRAEGIFMVEGEHAIIVSNVIKENMDGVLLSAASPLIANNEIVANRRCGIIMVSQCNPKVVHNLIIKNYACGVLIRQNSLGIIEKNEVRTENDRVDKGELLPDIDPRTGEDAVRGHPQCEHHRGRLRCQHDRVQTAVTRDCYYTMRDDDNGRITSNNIQSEGRTFVNVIQYYWGHSLSISGNAVRMRLICVSKLLGASKPSPIGESDLLPGCS